MNFHLKKNWLQTSLSSAGALIRGEWRAFAVVIAASAVQAFAVRYFTMHYRFPDLGVSGIAVLTNYAFGISPNWVILVGNLLLMLWGWRDLNTQGTQGLRFLVLTATAIATFSTFLSLFALYPLPLPEDKFMATMITGFLKGASGAMMLHVGGSGGGTDIMAVVLRRRYGIEMGRFSILINLSILTLSIGVVGLEAFVYGAAGLYVNGLMVDNVTHAFDRRKQAFIITNVPDEVSGFINAMHRGVTRLEGRGAYTGQPRPVLLTLLEPRQVMLVKRFLRERDPSAFVSICDATEVLGLGFKSWRSL